MTTAALKLATGLAAVAVVNYLLAVRVLAAPNDAQDLHNVVTGFATSWNRHDLQAFGRLFAPDANFVNVAGLL